MEITETLYVTDRRAWRAWLKQNHAKAKEIWLIYYRQETGRPRIPYNDAVEEALCFGWIDSTTKKLDGERFVQRFSPRRRGSNLSQSNIERIHKLIARGKMTPAGLAAVAGVYPPAGAPEAFSIPADILGPLQANAAAWENFQKMPEDYRRVRVAYIDHQRRRGPEYFRKSLDHFLKMTARGKRFGIIKL